MGLSSNRTPLMFRLIGLVSKIYRFNSGMNLKKINYELIRNIKPAFLFAHPVLQLYLLIVKDVFPAQLICHK